MSGRVRRDRKEPGVVVTWLVTGFPGLTEEVRPITSSSYIGDFMFFRVKGPGDLDSPTRPVTPRPVSGGGAEPSSGTWP
jgi:hypothetical protein